MPSVGASLRRGDVRVAFADLDLVTYKRELEADAALLEALLADVAPVTPAHDTKLRHALDYVAAKAQAPLNDGKRKGADLHRLRRHGRVPVPGTRPGDPRP